MKKISLFIIPISLFLFFGLVKNSEAAITPKAEIQAILQKVDATKIKNHTRTISESGLRSAASLDRGTTSGNYITMNYLFNTLNALYPNNTFRHDYKTHANGLKESNIIAIKRGKAASPKVIVISAHFDSTCVSSGYGDCEKGGADDNASGTAGLLMMAEALANVDTQQTIVFAAMNDEESWMVGSYAFVNLLKGAGFQGIHLGDILLDFTVDTIAYLPSTNTSKLFDYESNEANVSLMNEVADYARAYSTVTPQIITPASGSDHIPFLDNGIPAFQTVEEYTHYSIPYYHTSSDMMNDPPLNGAPSNVIPLNFDYAAEITKAGLAFVIDKAVLVQTQGCTGASPTWQTTPDYASVNDCVGKAKDGDVINISAGTGEWGNSNVSWTDKNIQIIGAGIDQTILNISGWGFIVDDNTKAKFRISGMTINGGTNLDTSSIHIRSMYQTELGSAPVYMSGWRVDHVKFTPSASAPNMSINMEGVNWGLINNCIFESLYSGTAEHNFMSVGTSYYQETNFYPYWGGYDWSLPLDLGTWKALYVENNTFYAPYTQGTARPFDLQTGGRIVFRHNNVTGGCLTVHPPKTGQIGGIKYEIYGNTFTTGAFWLKPFEHQGGGTGVIFNNSFLNGGSHDWGDAGFGLSDRRVITSESGDPLYNCDGTASHTWDGKIEPSGWPCFTQLGRRPPNANETATGNQKYWLYSEPLYAWNNGREATCATFGACTDTFKLYTATGAIENYIKDTSHSNGQVDFVNNGNIPNPGYQKFTDPYPINVATGMPDPTATSCLTKGDFTCNGYSLSDLQTMIRIILGTDSTTSRTQADMNNDTLVNISDLQLLINKVLGIN